MGIDMVLLRKLKMKDAPLMYEWLNDADIVSNLCLPEGAGEMSAILQYIEQSEAGSSLHCAFTLKDDEYMGTVSLKDITSGEAELAMVARKCAQGKGYAQSAARKMLQIGFETLGLKRIWLSVYAENERAKRLYARLGFLKTERTDEKCGKKLEYFEVRSGRFKKIISSAFAQEMDLKVNEKNGCLVAIENASLPFKMKRIFYMYDISGERGDHANLRSGIVMAALSGSLKVLCDNGFEKRTFTLEKPSKALFIPAGIYRKMYDFKDTVLLCISDRPYDSSEYICGHEEFLTYARRRI